ncbi:hypothetical protein COLU111180_17240 [Cohnella lubricantis]|nr:hypothetical protein [Cohnella lubricantis]
MVKHRRKLLKRLLRRVYPLAVRQTERPPERWSPQVRYPRLFAKRDLGHRSAVGRQVWRITLRW